MVSAVGVEGVRGIGLGTAQFAFKGGSREQSVAVVRAALDAGIQFIDTALAYTRPGVASWAESIVGTALRDDAARHEVVVATKGGHWREDDEFPIDGRERRLRDNCEVSLRELGVEVIDLYQLHHVDPVVPLEESVAALAALQAEGKIRQIGLSNVSIDQLESARRITPVASVQNRLSFDRFEDIDMVRHCENEGIRYLAYSPLDGPGSLVAPQDPRRAMAAASGVSVQLLTLAWLQRLSAAIVPLVGASRAETIVDSARSSGWPLSAEDLDAITREAEAL